MSEQFIKVPLSLLCNPNLSAEAKLLYCRLKLFDGSKSGECWPGVDTIASEMGWTKRTATRHIAELVTAGLIERVRRGRGLTWIYRFVGSDTPDLAHQKGSRRATFGVSDTPDLAHGDTPDLAHAIKEEKINAKRSIEKSERRASSTEQYGRNVEDGASEAAPARPPSFPEKGKTKNRDTETRETPDPEQPTEVETIKTALRESGVSFRASDPARLLDLAGDSEALCRFIREKAQAKRKRRQPIESAALLLRMFADGEFESWRARNGVHLMPVAAKRQCWFCDGFFEGAESDEVCPSCCAKLAADRERRGKCEQCGSEEGRYTARFGLRMFDYQCDKCATQYWRPFLAQSMPGKCCDVATGQVRQGIEARKQEVLRELAGLDRQRAEVNRQKAERAAICPRCGSLGVERDGNGFIYADDGFGKRCECEVGQTLEEDVRRTLYAKRKPKKAREPKPVNTAFAPITQADFEAVIRAKNNGAAAA